MYLKHKVKKKLKVKKSSNQTFSAVCHLIQTTFLMFENGLDRKDAVFIIDSTTLNNINHILFF